MHNSPMPSPALAATHHLPSAAPAADRCSNSQIKVLLKDYGLRTSLIRLKVIDALLGAERAGQTIGVRAVHTHLQELDIPLSFLSVREVLKRLCSEGVIDMRADKTYGLSQHALGLLRPFPLS
ncbi:hypothetical protein PMM47T1_12161 [Pseudomonas sp. M47T1]|uniref:hypothetical protein n=1 Tax=Pseudomonas sp. M47T1 TaxID=1179778 RepID=UPI00026067A4|nr:hypothetical protein [Pseudomonas sp. M47T1]EIK96363.1 hypothetical protein PMM47T1_12161 [Pseudomonas sp. M47T1]